MAEQSTDVIAGTLDMLILKSLSLQPMHGFGITRSEEHTSELQSRFGISYAVFCLNDTATTEIYTLSLHVALPISTDVIAGTLDMLILKTLSLQPMHGFGIT